MKLADGSTIRWAGEVRSTKPGAIAVRPENLIVSLSEPKEDAATNRLKARMRQRIFAGPTVTCLLEWQEQPIKVLAKEGELSGIPDTGDVWIEWPAEKSIAIPVE